MRVKSNFIVGDVVALKEATSHWTIDDIAEVIEVGVNDRIMIKLDSDNSHHWIESDSAELITPVFKIGEMVTVKHSYSGAYFVGGDIGIVRQVGISSDVSLEILNKRNKYYYWIKTRYLNPVEKTKPKPKHYMTLFQTLLPEDKDTLWDIIKIFHPDARDIEKHRMVVSIKYDWVMVKMSGHTDTTQPVQISLGIENSSLHPMIYGGPKPIKVFQDALDNNQVSFRVWRFADDDKYLKDQTGVLDQLKLDTELRKQAVELLKSRGYDLQTAFEMYTLYHQD